MSSERRTEPRIAVVLQGDAEDPRSWSGSPAGLFGGLRAAGAEPLAIDARPPGMKRLTRTLRVRWEREAASGAFAAASGAWAGSRLRRAGRIDGVVAIGSGYELRPRVPTVTFEDETVAQAMRLPYSDPATLPRRAARRWQRRQRRIYERCRACCVGSEWAARSVREDYGIDGSRVRIVGFGRNLAPPPRPERDWTTPRFLFVGVDWERKRGPDVLAAFATVRARHPEARLDVVGGHPPLDAPGVTEHGQLSLASRADRARLEGLLSRATCLTLPSAREAFGIAYLDAGAAGVPSIGTTVGGAADAIGDGGVLVPPEDEGALESAMLMLCAPEEARALGGRASAHSALLTWKAVAERVLRALRPAGVDVAGLAEFLEPAKPQVVRGSGEIGA